MNLRPPGYEPDELPSCSTPRHSVAFIGDIDYYTLFQQFCQEGAESFFAAEAEGENAAADLLSRKPAATPIHAPPRGATRMRKAKILISVFQFTPLREGRHAVGAFAGRRAHFNSRPSARGDELLPRTHVKAVIFQFTPLREGRPARAVALSTTIRFQFTPLREGRLVHQVQPPRQPEFQFTPLREGRHALAAWLGG